VNLLLVAIVCWQADQLRQQEAALVASTPTTSVPDPATRSPSLPAEQYPSPLTKQTPLSSASARPAFDWRQVESTDYPTYIRNLRATGCPEQTVRDIVTADMAATFATRRAEVMAARYREFKYWETGATKDAVLAEMKRQQRSVDAEMGEVLQNLLGPDAAPPATTRDWHIAELDQQLSFLPADKQDATRALLLRSEANDALIKSLSEARRPTEDTDELNRILQAYDGKRAELARTLSPEEIEQLDMTVSWTANNLRRAMVKFDPTEAEFQEIFRAWRAHDENLAQLYATGQPDPGNGHVFARIKEFLGEERFKQYRSTWWK
jgi:hypothetical protein